MSFGIFQFPLGESIASWLHVWHAGRRDLFFSLLRHWQSFGDRARSVAVCLWYLVAWCSHFALDCALTSQQYVTHPCNLRLQLHLLLLLPFSAQSLQGLAFIMHSILSPLNSVFSCSEFHCLSPSYLTIDSIFCHFESFFFYILFYLDSNYYIVVLFLNYKWLTFHLSVLIFLNFLCYIALEKHAQCMTESFVSFHRGNTSV